jgi:hypothetical protein
MTVEGACGGRYLPPGCQEVERETGRGQGQDIFFKGMTLSDLLPPTRLHLLVFTIPQ